MMRSELVLLLGGSGYIGTHIMLELHGKVLNTPTGRFRCQVGIISNRFPSVEAIEYAEKKAGGLRVLNWHIDLENNTDLSTYPEFPSIPYCGIMLAALRNVSEAEIIPHEYIRTNVALCVNSMKYLTKLGVKRLIQASSSSVYHTTQAVLFHHENIEGHDYGEPLGIYGYTKRVTEDICIKLLPQGNSSKLAVLRYMNPIGSHPDVKVFSEIGICTQLAKMEPEHIFTNRGDCVRDYIHITDLASYHTALLESWEKTIFPPTQSDSVLILNVGTGVRTTVNELVSKFWAIAKMTPRTLVVGERPEYEGFDTVGSMVRTIRRLPEWWKKHSCKTLEESLRDYSCVIGGRISTPF